MRSLALVTLVGCMQPTFSERMAELEAARPESCADIIGCAGEQRVLDAVDCMRLHLAKGTAGKTRQTRASSEQFLYTVNGHLVVLERGYDTGAWGEVHCQAISHHSAGPTCNTIEPIACDGEQ